MQRLLIELARWAVQLYYRVRHLGGEVPASGPVILVANHPNGLVDPILVASTTRRPVRFLGKAPLFEMPVLGQVMRGLKALPVYRSQDGADTADNSTTFAAVFDALERGELVCLFPEGKSHDEPELQRLKTGAARMALGAEARAAHPLGVRVVPVGLVYRAKPSFRSQVAVWVGAPIDLSDLCERQGGDGGNDGHNEDSERAAVQALNERIAAGLRSVTLNLERWEDLPLLELAERILFSERAGRLERLGAFASALRALRLREPALVTDLGGRIATFGDRLGRLGLEARDLPDRLEQPYRPGSVLRFALRNLLVLLLGLPLAGLGAVLWFLPHRFVGWLPKRFSTPDTLATARILAAFVFFPLWLGLLVLLAWWSQGGRTALVLLVAAGPLGLLALAFRDWRSSTLAEVRTFLRLASRTRLRRLLAREREGLAQELEALRART